MMRMVIALKLRRLQIMQGLEDFSLVEPHGQLTSLFPGRAQKALTMIDGFANGGFQRQAGIIYAIAAIRKARSSANMGESGHDHGRPRATDAVRRRHQKQIADFLPDSFIGQAFNFPQRFHFGGVDQFFKEIDRRINRGNDAKLFLVLEEDLLGLF